jgi:prevent-host-death family protein
LTRNLTAKELKNRTGEALRAVQRGDRVLVTRRGKPLALIVPIRSVEEFSLPPFEEAWSEIEQALARSRAAFPTLAAAMSKTRRRR